MNNLILTKEWMKASEDDLILIGEIIHNEILTHLIAFHSQQAVEKSLKALLVFQNIDIPKTHSLNKLFKMCEAYIDVKNTDLVHLLDSLYIESRYPGDMGLLPYGKPTLQDAKMFYDFAKNIYLEINNSTRG